MQLGGVAWLDQVSRRIPSASESGADVSTVSNVDDPVIRRATNRDVPALARLRAEFTLEDGPISSPREDFDAAFASIVSTGLGGRVLEAAKDWAKDEDVELLVVWPSDESVSFYRRHGFVGEREPLVWLNQSASE